MTDAPQKDTRNMFDVFIQHLTGADRVVLEKKNALGEMDAHYLYAPNILEAFNTRADHAQAELTAAVVAAYEDCWEQGKQAGRFAPDIPADALTALKSVKREARNEALREAEAAISKLRMQNQDIVSQWNGAIDQASDVILALMEDQSDE